MKQEIKIKNVGAAIQSIENGFLDYRPKGILRFLLIFVKLGFGVGKLKQFLSKSVENINGKKPIDIVYHSLHLRLFPHDNTIENKLVVSSRLREGKELSFIEPFIGNGGTFVDVGANVGYYSLMAAKLGAKKVLSIEPNPVLLDRLHTNIGFNNFGHIIETAQIGVGDKKGVFDLHISETDLGSSSVVNVEEVNNRKIVIETDLLENVISKAKIENIDAMKIDIEGFEDRVLFPFFESVEKKKYPKLIVIEDDIHGVWERNILEYLLENGYQEIGRTRGNVIIQLESN